MWDSSRVWMILSRTLLKLPCTSQSTSYWASQWKLVLRLTSSELRFLLLSSLGKATWDSIWWTLNLILPSEFANSCACSTDTARKCDRSFLLPAKRTTMFESEWSRNSVSHFLALLKDSMTVKQVIIATWTEITNFTKTSYVIHQ